MADYSIRHELDTIIKNTETYNENLIPTELLSNLKKWKWGSYGWVSPASLMFTATWRKYYYPSVDCCMIWAEDETKQPIPGGYSIRTEDETISIPLLAKYDLCEGFCSPNSGMQGSRAIEKMRSLKRLNVDFDSAQRTYFDLKLFASILNQINNLEKAQLMELIKYFIVVAKGIRQKRLEDNALLKENSSTDLDVLSILKGVPDPEFTKCVAAACLDLIYSPHGLILEGVKDHKTAADARAQKPGDLTLTKDNLPIMAVEVKDKSQCIDWNNIERAKRIINLNNTLTSFIFILENRQLATTPIINEIVSSQQLTTEDGKVISVVSLHEIYYLARAIASEAEIVNKTGCYLSEAPAVKPETKAIWIAEVCKQ